MKLEELNRPGLLAMGAVGLLGLAAMAGAAFAAGVAVGRDPEAARRRARELAGWAAGGIERAALLAAQAREQLGDLWAEARADAVHEVDEADFARAQATVEPATSTAAAAASTAAAQNEPAQTAPARSTGTRRASRPRARKRPAAGTPAGEAAPE
jgi:hypothetical protein